MATTARATAASLERYQAQALHMDRVPKPVLVARMYLAHPATTVQMGSTSLAQTQTPRARRALPTAIPPHAAHIRILPIAMLAVTARATLATLERYQAQALHLDRVLKPVLVD